MKEIDAFKFSKNLWWNEIVQLKPVYSRFSNYLFHMQLHNFEEKYLVIFRIIRLKNSASSLALRTIIGFGFLVGYLRMRVPKPLRRYHIWK